MVAKREEIADGQRLDLLPFHHVRHGGAHSVLVERPNDLTFRPNCLDSPDSPPWGEENRRFRIDEQVVHLGPLLATDDEHILEARRGQDAERAPFCPHRIGGNRRPVDQARTRVKVARSPSSSTRRSHSHEAPDEPGVASTAPSQRNESGVLVS